MDRCSILIYNAYIQCIIITQQKWHTIARFLLENALKCLKRESLSSPSCNYRIMWGVYTRAEYNFNIQILDITKIMTFY